MVAIGDRQQGRQIPCRVGPDVVGLQLCDETLALRSPIIDDDNPVPRFG